MRLTFLLLTALAATGAMAQSTTNVATDDYKFSYTYPAEAARIPALRAWLNADHAAVRAKLVRDATSWRVDTKRHSIPLHRYEAQKTWKMVTDTPRFLSLSASVYSFTGGAHGNYFSTALVWDKAAHRPLRPRTRSCFPRSNKRSRLLIALSSRPSAAGGWAPMRVPATSSASARR